MISKWQTTIGGKVLGIKIVHRELASLTFVKASIRFIVSILPFVIYSYVRGMQHMMDVAPSPTVQMLPQLIFILLPFVMFFSKKRQMLHDMVVKSIVIDVNRTTKKDDVAGDRIVPLGRTILRIVGGVLFLIVFGYVLVYTSVFYMLGKHSANNYDASFHTKYQVNDFNDTRILFYKKELEKYSKEFIDAEGMYDIFAADTKKDLALNCIQASLKEHNVSDWIEVGSNFRKNARNKYADTAEKIKKAKRNESYMGHHFYDYDLNDVNEIENDIASIWDPKKNKKTCEQKLPVEDMYVLFLSKYIKNREETKIRWTDDLARENQTDKRFWKKQIEKTAMWIEELYRQNPKYLTEKLEKQKAVDLEVKQIEEEYNKIEFNKKKNQKEQNEIIYKKDLKRGVPPIFAAIQNHLYEKLIELLDDGADIELKNKFGTRPLSFAIYHQDTKIIETLLKYGANPNVIDGNGLYSPLSEACVTNKIKIVKLLLKYGADVNYQYKKSETALTVASKGCRNFELVKLLLDNGANPTLMDTYGYNTLTGLRRYCRDDEAYEDMKSFIERNTQ